MSQENPFKDVSHFLRKEFGSLGGDAIQEHFAAHAEPSEDGLGVQVSSRCDHCGVPTGVVAYWAEVIAIGFKVPRLPGWLYDPSAKMMRPELRCSCGWPIEIGLTPDECGRFVKSAIDAGRITQQQVQQVGVQVGALQR